MLVALISYIEKKSFKMVLTLKPSFALKPLSVKTLLDLHLPKIVCTLEPRNYFEKMIFFFGLRN